MSEVRHSESDNPAESEDPRSIEILLELQGIKTEGHQMRLIDKKDQSWGHYTARGREYKSQPRLKLCSECIEKYFTMRRKGPYLCPACRKKKIAQQAAGSCSVI